MARLPDDVIERIKTDISLLRLVESQGHCPKKQGKDYAINCPFHDGDETPSLFISTEKNLFNCFGCGVSGGVIDWVMKTQGVSFRFAAELLMKDLGMVAETGTKTVKQNTTTKIPSPLAAITNEQELLHQVVDYYHETLKQSREALEYLEKRGLHSSELIERFKLGFANRTLGYRLPAKNRKAGAESRQRLQELGILRQSGHEHFNGSLVVPVIDAQGKITEIYGRKIRDDLRRGTAKHLYLPGEHAGVWNSEALKASAEIILCEALIDAMTFWVHGFRHVTASYGTNGFTDDHLRLFKQHGVERVLIAYDRDKAGDEAVKNLVPKLTAAGIGCFRILLPKGMDVNEYALQVTPAQKSLGLVIRQAEWLGNGKPPERQLDIEQLGVAPQTATVKPVVAEQAETKPTEPQPEAPKIVEPTPAELKTPELETPSPLSRHP